MEPSQRLVVNSAISVLTEGWDKEAANCVIQHCQDLPPMKIFSTEKIHIKKDEDIPVTGFTKEQGDVTIGSSREEVQEQTTGVYKERIGYYRVYMVRRGVLEFHHFWKSGLTTQSEDADSRPTVYRLQYDPKSLEPQSLSFWCKKVVFTFRFFSSTCQIVHNYLVPTFGKPKGFVTSAYGVHLFF